MDDPAQLSEYGKILLIAIVGAILVCVTIFLAKIISPKQPNPEKLSTYECGEQPIGSAWVQINPRFYVIALVFLLFDVELIFVFPWATVFGDAHYIGLDARWGWFTMVEMAIFLGILVVGLVYVWKRGDIVWIKPEHQRPVVRTGIPATAYDEINAKQYVLRDFSVQVSSEAEMPLETKAAPAAGLGFRPKFKKNN